MTAYFDANVTLTIEVGFASNPLTASPTWTDISKYVRRFKINRGRQHAIGKMRPSTATLWLSNSDGRFDPSFTTGAYYPNVVPMKQVRITATHSTTDYRLFYGFVEAWPQTWPGHNDALVPLKAMDGFKLLNLIYTQTAEVEEASGTRIGNLLDDASWPAGWRDLATGDITCQAFTPVCSSVLSLVQQVSDTEHGLFFIAGDGDATFQERSYRAGLSSQGTFGDTAAEMQYHDLKLGYDDMQIWNRVEVSRYGGGTVAAQDATSITAYGQRTLKLYDLLHTDDAGSTTLAETVRDQYKDPHVRVESIVLQPRSDATNLWPQVLGRELSDKVTVNRRPPAGNTITAVSHIEGISHDVAVGGQWDTTWRLSQYGGP